MVKKDQTLEALATIRMCIDDNEKALECENIQATDADDFVTSEDDDGSDQFTPGAHWTLGAPKKLMHVSEIQRDRFPTFEVQLRQRLAELSPEEFDSGGFIPIKVRTRSLVLFLH